MTVKTLTQSLEQTIQDAIACRQCLYFFISNGQNLKTCPVDSIQDDDGP